MVRAWLRDAREAAGYTQKQIAEKIGIAAPSYNLIENSKTNPRVDNAKKIAELLHFNWTKFFEEGGIDNDSETR